jgi:hypothetical protein
MSAKLRLILLFYLIAQATAFAAFGVLPNGRLDMKGLRRAYMESDFVPVREALEGFMKAHKADATRDEKVFSHIYLGVIYAADSMEDAKAESHFNSLMHIAPNIELVDMFVPPQIQNIFDRVKHDYLRMKEYGQKYDALGNPIASPVDSSRPVANLTPEPKRPTQQGIDSKPENHEWLWWTLGGAAVVGAGVGVYLLTSTDGGHPAADTTKIVGP